MANPLPLRTAVIAAILGLAASTAHAASLPVVTLLGDSISAGYGLPDADALPAQLGAALAKIGVAARVRGAGVSGDTTAGGLGRVDFSVAPDTRLCIVELGGNDYLQSLPPADTERNLTAIVERLKARRIAVLLLGAPPPTHASGSYGRDFGTIFARVARAEHVRLAPDFFFGVLNDPALKQRDGLHPNAAGVRRIAGHLAPTVAAGLR